MKKKSLFRKAVALICCVALSLTTYVPVVDAATTAEPGKVFLKLCEGVTFIDSSGDEMISEEALGGDNYTCTYDAADNTIEFVYDYETTGTSRTTWAVNDVISFYAKVDDGVLKVAPSSAAGSVTNTEFVDEDGNYKGANRRIEVKLGKAITRNGLFLTTSVELAKYDVTFPISGNDYVVTVGGKELDKEETFQYEKGSDVVFQVKATEAGKDIEVWNGRTQVTAVDGDYTLANITSDVSLTIKLVDKKYTVTGASGEAYTYTPVGSETVSYGGDFLFYVNPKTGYGDIKSVSYTMNGETKQATNIGGTQYMIKNITDHVQISVEASGLNKYHVNYPAGTGYTVSGDQEIAYGGTLAFTVTPADGYTVTVRATMGGRTVTAVKGENTDTYTITNVTGDVDITVTAVRKSYQVKVVNQAGNAATTNAVDKIVSHGDEYTFIVSPADGYKAPNVSVDHGTVVSLGNNQYAVTNITREITITITGGDGLTYNVNRLEGLGFSYNETGSLTGIAYGGSYLVSITVDPQYSNSEVVISVNGTPVAATPGEDHTYTYNITNITADQTVSVSGLVKNTYKVTFVNGTGYTFATTDNTTVSAGSSFSFSLNILPGFEGKNVKVLANGVEVTTVENGIYTIEVNEATAITVAEGTVTATTFKAVVEENQTANVQAEIDFNPDKIAYNGSYKFKVSAIKGYKVTQVAIDGVVATAVNGVYTVNNVTKDFTITVVTEVNKLTVNYIVDVNHHAAPQGGVYSYTAFMTELLNPAHEDCPIHTFIGWIDADGNEVSVESLQELIAGSDASVTLTAKFEVNTEPDILKLFQTTKEAMATGNGRYRITFRTVVGDLSTDVCLAEYVKVTGFGTLLAGKEGAAFDEAKALLGERDMSSNVVNGDKVLGTGQDAIYNYYINGDYTWEEFKAVLSEENTHSTIILKINNVNKEENPLNAVGWIEFEINGKRIQILGDASGINLVRNV